MSDSPKASGGQTDNRRTVFAGAGQALVERLVVLRPADALEEEAGHVDRVDVDAARRPAPGVELALGVAGRRGARGPRRGRGLRGGARGAPVRGRRFRRGPGAWTVRPLGLLLDPGQGDEVRLARGQEKAQEVLLLEGHGIEDERAALEREALRDAVRPDVERAAQPLPPDLGQDPGQGGAGEFGGGEPVVHVFNVSSGRR